MLAVHVPYVHLLEFGQDIFPRNAEPLMGELNLKMKIRRINRRADVRIDGRMAIQDTQIEVDRFLHFITNLPTTPRAIAVLTTGSFDQKYRSLNAIPLMLSVRDKISTSMSPAKQFLTN